VIIKKNLAVFARRRTLQKNLSIVLKSEKKKGRDCLQNQILIHSAGTAK